MSLRTIVLIALGLGFLYGLFTVGSPFLLAIIFAILLEPINLFLMKYARMNRVSAVTLVCTVFTLVLTLIMYVIGFKVITESYFYLTRLPDYLNNLNYFVQQTIHKTQLFYETLPADTAAQLQQGAESGINALMSTLESIVGSLSASLLNFAKMIPNFFIFFLVFIVGLYLFSFSLNTLKGSFLTLFEEKSRNKVEEVLDKLRNAIFGFIRAQLLISSLTYIITLIGLMILRIDFAIALALLVIIVDILPILGTGSVLIPWAVYLLVQGDSFVGFGLIVLYLVITIVRRLVEPKILGDSVGIGALSALISMYVGFKLVGVIGLFLGPIVVIIYQAMQKVGLLNIKIKLE